MRYIIYGAGAIGGTIGAGLFEAGRDVVLIARGDHGRAIKSGGLRFGPGILAHAHTTWLSDVVTHEWPVRRV